jgi:hypothetical protein
VGWRKVIAHVDKVQGVWWVKSPCVRVLACTYNSLGRVEPEPALAQERQLGRGATEPQPCGRRTIAAGVREEKSGPRVAHAPLKRNLIRLILVHFYCTRHQPTKCLEAAQWRRTSIRGGSRGWVAWTGIQWGARVTLLGRQVTADG